jgi:hypothetical protein
LERFLEVLEFDAELISFVRGGVGFYFPFNVHEVFGKRSIIKVKCTFDGYPYRGSLAPMGDGKHGLGVLKEIRKAIGKNIGDTVHVILEEDTDSRLVDIPTDLTNIFLLNLEAKLVFDKKSYTFRKEQVSNIVSSKAEEIRLKRIMSLLEILIKE